MDEFRDTLATTDKDGKRLWLYPKQPKGKLYNYRSYVSYLLLMVLVVTPFIKINNAPIFLFNVLERQFIFFGIIFTPQDLHLFALAMITFMIFIILFTVIFGRLFCGWVCPQTIFLEMVFRKIEYWIEGSANQQKKLNAKPWTREKYIKKIAKHVIFFSISVFIANIFLSYVIGVDALQKIITDPFSAHLDGFFAMIIFSFVFYYVFAFFREQVCIAVCPYGRLQSVLLVKNSIVVIYDWVRGEPRGKLKKSRKKETFVELPLAQAAPLGDCIDCSLCVQVCPTGIDIRNGTQLECVNCTACIDACDEVMEKISKPKGLIRYDSHEGVETKQSKIFTTRVFAYSAVLLALLLFQSFLLTNRNDIELIIQRTPGVLFQEKENGQISNLYNFQVMNKTYEEVKNMTFKVYPENAKIQLIGKQRDQLSQLESMKGSFFIEINKTNLSQKNSTIEISIFSNGELIDKVETNFLGPNK